MNAELETARALYDIGDDEDALRIVVPLAEREDFDALNRLSAFQLKACIEWRRSQFQQSLETLRQAGPLVDGAPANLRAKYFGQRALDHRALNDTDAALVDYEHARDCARESGDERTEASIRNNIAMIYSEIGRTDEALREVDIATRAFLRLDDEINVGSCHDTRAQILINSKRYAEALTYSVKAVRLLADNPAGAAARTTYGVAMIGVGITHLEEEPKTIAQFRARHDAAKIIDVELNPALIRAALARSHGHVFAAAKLLSVSHSVLIKLISKHKLERVPRRRRGLAHFKK